MSKLIGYVPVNQTLLWSQVLRNRTYDHRNMYIDQLLCLSRLLNYFTLK